MSEDSSMKMCDQKRTVAAVTKVKVKQVLRVLKEMILSLPLLSIMTESLD